MPAPSKKKQEKKPARKSGNAASDAKTGAKPGAGRGSVKPAAQPSGGAGNKPVVGATTKPKPATKPPSDTDKLVAAQAAQAQIQREIDEHQQFLKQQLEAAAAAGNIASTEQLYDENAKFLEEERQKALAAAGGKAESITDPNVPIVIPKKTHHLRWMIVSIVVAVTTFLGIYLGFKNEDDGDVARSSACTKFLAEGGAEPSGGCDPNEKVKMIHKPAPRTLLRAGLAFFALGWAVVFLRFLYKRMGARLGARGRGTGGQGDGEEYEEQGDSFRIFSGAL